MAASDKILGRKHGRKITVSRPMITVVHADERRLIVKLLTPVYTVVFAVLHAPHSEDALVQEWFTVTKALLAMHAPLRVQRIILIDANARSPMEESWSFGSAGATTATKTTDDFLSLALEARVWTPAPFEEYTMTNYKGLFISANLPHSPELIMSCLEVACRLCNTPLG